MAAIEFAELCAKSYYTFLEGASSPEQMVETAFEAGYRAMGIVDKNGVYGLPRAWEAARKRGLKLLYGAEVMVAGERAHFLVEDKNGYGNLCELLTLAHEDRENPHLEWDRVFAQKEGLLVLLPVDSIVSQTHIATLKAEFSDRLLLVTSLWLDGADDTRLTRAIDAESRFHVPVIATNEPLFHQPSQKVVQDILSAIRHSIALKDGGRRFLPNAERFLKPVSQLERLYFRHPEWLRRTVPIAESCHFDLSELRYHYPREWLPPGETSDSYLSRLTWDGANRRYPQGIPPDAEKQIRRELALIQELEYHDYFLTIWDIVEFARKKGILCQGRGSAANSIVCYALGITAIDPVRMQLLFERFISRERSEPPDIDIDFEHERREEVIQYLYERYGRERAAITAEVICFRRKSALREVGKAFGLPVRAIEIIQTLSHRRPMNELSFDEVTQALPDIPSPLLRRYLDLSFTILGFPRHLGTHVGGFVLSHERLTRSIPVEKAAMAGRTICQWDKNDLDALGFVRVDVLGLGILTAIRKSFEILSSQLQKPLTLATVPAEDKRVYDMIAKADTVGVFQIESRAQMNMLPRLKPDHFYDLVVEISLVRPGPIQGDMVHPYLRRRAGLETVDYPHPSLEAILKKTYGVPLFQEQIMRMAMEVAGFSGGEADELRRAMGTWRRHGGNRLSPMGEKFKKGLLARGIPESFADRVFSQIEGFAEYGFPESHAASFAILAYVTAYLKCHHPDVFLTALLNSQPMGFYSSHSLIHDGIRHGVIVEGIDISHSTWDNRLLAPGRVGLGMRQIKGLHRRVATLIESVRARAPFTSFGDFTTRLQSEASFSLTKRDLFLLAGAHAFTAFLDTRRDAWWEIQALSLPDSPIFSSQEVKTLLPEEGDWEKTTLDYNAQGVSLTAHPILHFRESLKRRGASASSELAQIPPGKRACVGGLVICRQMPPTASGVLFITLEDEFGFVNLVIWNRVFEKFRSILLTQSLLLAEGKLEKAEGTSVSHLIVDSVEPLLPSEELASLSHDFH